MLNNVLIGAFEQESPRGVFKGYFFSLGLFMLGQYMIS